MRMIKQHMEYKAIFGHIWKILQVYEWYFKMIENSYETFTHTFMHNTLSKVIEIFIEKLNCILF